jgi:inosine-uridine nucleoside N-ribohydrolase
MLLRGLREAAAAVVLCCVAAPGLTAPVPLHDLMMMDGGAVTVPEKRVPVILDTDIGDDIDDTWALAMLLGCPEVDLKLVVTDFGDTVTKARLVAKLLEAMGRSDIPVGIGLKTSDAQINQAQWLGDYDMKTYPGEVHEDGVQALIDAIHAAPEPVTLLVIGPVPNIREALKRDPSIAHKARIVAMAGSVDVGYGGAPKPCPEWNVVADVPSYRALFAAPWEITIAPLDCCGEVILSGEDYQRVVSSANPRAAAVIANYDQWANRHDHPAGSSSVLFDTAAAYASFDESCAEIETIKLSVTDDGSTARDPGGRPVRCMMGWKDYRGYIERLLGALTAGD